MLAKDKIVWTCQTKITDYRKVGTFRTIPISDIKIYFFCFTESNFFVHFTMKMNIFSLYFYIKKLTNFAIFSLPVLLKINIFTIQVTDNLVLIQSIWKCSKKLSLANLKIWHQSKMLVRLLKQIFYYRCYDCANIDSVKQKK